MNNSLIAITFSQLLLKQRLKNCEGLHIIIINILIFKIYSIYYIMKFVISFAKFMK